MRRRVRSCLLVLLGALVCWAGLPRQAFADVAIGPVVVFGFGALVVAALAVVGAVVALVIIIRGVRKDRRGRTENGGGPVPPDGR